MNATKKPLTDFQIESIDEVIDSFDFPKVLKVMRALNWKYGVPGKMSEYYEPEIHDLKKFARQLLRSVYTEDMRGAESGGFVVFKFEDGFIKLYFSIENSDSERLVEKLEEAKASETPAD